MRFTRLLRASESSITSRSFAHLAPFKGFGEDRGGVEQALLAREQGRTSGAQLGASTEPLRGGFGAFSGVF